MGNWMLDVRTLWFHPLRARWKERACGDRRKKTATGTIRTAGDTVGTTVGTTVENTVRNAVGTTV